MTPFDKADTIDAATCSVPGESSFERADSVRKVNGFRGKLASLFSFRRPKESGQNDEQDETLSLEQFSRTYFERHLFLLPSEYQKHLRIVLRICREDGLLDPDQIPLSYLNRIFEGDDGSQLMQRAVSRCVKNLQLSRYITKRALQLISESALRHLEANIQDRFSLDSCISDHDSFKDAEASRDDAMEERIYKMTLSERRNASKAMLKLIPGPLPRPNPLSLTDQELRAYFQAKPSVQERKSFYLSTYFRSAFLGLTNRALEPFISRAQEIRSFEEMARHYKLMILDILAGRSRSGFTETYEAGVPIPANVLFTKNGTDAGKLLFRNCIYRGDGVLVTPHEFDKFYDTLLGYSSGVTTLSEMSEEKVRKALKDEHINFILVSDVSRLGAQLPLEMFARIRDELVSQGRELYLIVDACQAVGRKPVDYSAIRPDAVIASAQKGSEINTETGFLMVNDRLIRRADEKGGDLKEDGNDVQKGTILGDKIVSAGVALKPELLRNLTSVESGLPDQVRDKFFAPVEKRHQALQDLSEYFTRVMDAIYTHCHSGSAEIINPPKLRDYDMKIDRGQLTGIFEIRLRNCSIKTLKKHASYYGVSLDIIKDGSLDEPTVRIALHPYMNFEAIRILGYVFLKALKGKA